VLLSSTDGQVQRSSLSEYLPEHPSAWVQVDDLVDSTAQRVKEEVPDRAAQLSDTINIGAAQVCLPARKQHASPLPVRMELMQLQPLSWWLGTSIDHLMISAIGPSPMLCSS
jgi:hypothetical protein